MRITRIVRFALAVMVTVVSVGVFGAAPAGAQMYVGLEAGPAFYMDSELSPGPGPDLEYETGFNVGGVLGAHFLDIARGELAVSYRLADTDDAGPLPVSGDLGVLGVMGNAYLDLELGDDVPVTPYLGFGIGLGAAFADFRAGSTNVEDEDVVFAYNVLAGVGFDVTEEVVLQVGYRYFATTDPEIQGVDVELDIHELVFGARYEF